MIHIRSSHTVDMLPSSVAKTWLCQGLVNTDSVDWVETGAGWLLHMMEMMEDQIMKCVGVFCETLFGCMMLKCEVQFEGVCGRPLKP